MTYLIVALLLLLATVFVQALRIGHLTTDRDAARRRVDRQAERASRLLLWGTALRAQIVAEREAERLMLEDADDALRARYRQRDTAIQYAHPADQRQIRPVILPGPRTGDLAEATTAHNMPQEVAL